MVLLTNTAPVLLNCVDVDFGQTRSCSTLALCSLLATRFLLLTVAHGLTFD